MSARHLEDLAPAPRDLLERSLAWLDRLWDDGAGMIRAPSRSIYEHPHGGTAHLCRETAQYALGLLARNRPGDAARAVRAIGAVLALQFDAPEQPYHGTWPRAPQEPAPPPNPREWQDYDPNWREFIGTALALALIEYELLLPPELVRDIDRALRLAIAGTLARSVAASYTNIALMCVFLLQYGADRFGEAGWMRTAERLAEAIYALYAPHATFAEYNSPTYYGVDLYALAIWRRYAIAPRLRELGATMEAGLWRDIARFYHAGLKNLCGPFDRSYWMGLGRYASVMNLWIWMAVGREQIAFPDTTRPFAQAWDFAAASTYILPGVQVPDDVLPHLRAFGGERLVERTIADAPRRVASAWLAGGVMIGAEDSSSTHRVDPQFHPATMHWRCLDGSIGWMRARHRVPIDAWAKRGALELTCTRHPAGDVEIMFQISAADADLGRLRRERWELPGLAVDVESDASDMATRIEHGLIELRYTARDTAENAPVRFTLRISADQAKKEAP